jgi:hypothetical protein
MTEEATRNLTGILIILSVAALLVCWVYNELKHGSQVHDE